MKMKRIKFCKICGKECDKLFDGMCKKHYLQMKTYGKIINANQRTVFDPNELRVYNNYAEIDTYDSFGGVFKTYKIDLDDIPKLGKCKWRTIVKTRNGVESYYLGTGHTIYFHRLIMGNPNCEIDHLNRNTLDNRKSNLRALSNSANRINCAMKSNNTLGVKGVYYIAKNNKYKAEFRYNNKRYNTKHFDTFEEAVYMRFLFEQHFIPELSINNTVKVHEIINKLSADKKHEIESYFANRMKIQV